MKYLLLKVFRLLRRFKKVDHQKVFSGIYKDGVWGRDEAFKFYSGTGSESAYSIPYTELISQFIKANKISSIVDLGCGDFRVGSKLTQANAVKYIGVDVVKELIDYNTVHFSNEKTSFYHSNIVRDKLPKAQLCLIRQVLQHLSNKDISKVLEKCRQFEYVIITEHQPIGDNVIPNIDKQPDENIRLGFNSGVYLDHKPFNKKVKELLTVYPEAEKNSKIVTYQVFI